MSEMDRRWLASWFSVGKVAKDKDSFVLGILCGIEFGLALAGFSAGAYAGAAFCLAMGVFCCFRSFRPQAADKNSPD